MHRTRRYCRAEKQKLGVEIVLYQTAFLITITPIEVFIASPLDVLSTRNYPFACYLYSALRS